MAEQTIKLDDSDIRYLTLINDTLQTLENKILALELTKLDVYDELKKVKARYKEYSSQLKDKYNIPVGDAEIDLENKLIKFQVADIVKEEPKNAQQIGGTKKARAVSKVPKPAPNEEPSQ